MPMRFEVTYTDKDNTEKTPVMLHRAILGSLERFLGILIEHYAGNFPLWLAPEQVRIMPISEKTNDYAMQLAERLKQSDLRVWTDLSDDKIGAKIVKAHSDRVPYMLVVGPKEAQQDAVNVRMRQSQQTVTVPVDQFIAKAKEQIAQRSDQLGM
jgi:threonyl-tRNA synthetase